MRIVGPVPVPPIPIKSSMLYTVLSGFVGFKLFSDISDVIAEVDADVDVGVDVHSTTRT